jgi:hypothetical protein
MSHEIVATVVLAPHAALPVRWSGRWAAAIAKRVP